MFYEMWVCVYIYIHIYIYIFLDVFKLVNRLWYFLKREIICLQHFDNTFTTNLKWQIGIGGQESNFSRVFKLKPITTFSYDLLWKYCEPNASLSKKWF